jgi:hypothetical protein
MEDTNIANITAESGILQDHNDDLYKFSNNQILVVILCPISIICSSLLIQIAKKRI